jgi:hypothetical protein
VKQVDRLNGWHRPSKRAKIAPASDWTLSEAEIAEIDALLAARARQLGRVGRKPPDISMLGQRR